MIWLKPFCGTEESRLCLGSARPLRKPQGREAGLGCFDLLLCWSTSLVKQNKKQLQKDRRREEEGGGGRRRERRRKTIKKMI